MAVVFTLAASSLPAASRSGAESTTSVVQAVPPAYPPIARAALVSGEVVVEAKLDAQGAVTSVNVIKGHKLLNGAAEKAASRWRFNSLDDGARERSVRLSFQFTLLPPNKGAPDDLGVIFWQPYKVEVRDTPYRVE